MSLRTLSSVVFLRCTACGQTIRIDREQVASAHCPQCGCSLIAGLAHRSDHDSDVVALPREAPMVGRTRTSLPPQSDSSSVAHQIGPAPLAFGATQERARLHRPESFRPEPLHLDEHFEQGSSAEVTIARIAVSDRTLRRLPDELREFVLALDPDEPWNEPDQPYTAN